MPTQPILNDDRPPADFFAPPARLYARLTLWIIGLVGALVIGVWAAATPGGLMGKADAIGYAICHRIAARSFFAGARQLPLCARCTGIYMGVITGLAFILVRGRSRAGRLPRVRVLVVMLVLGALYAADGLNSYLSLFDSYTPIYQPNNTLRLFTGTTFGLAMIMMVVPVLNTIAWAAPERRAPLDGLRDLGALYLIAGGVALIVLEGDVPLLRDLIGLISAVGTLVMFCVVGCVLFLTVSRRENTARRWRDLAVPAFAGLIFAILVIGGIDAVRYLFTGTWNGFTLPG